MRDDRPRTTDGEPAGADPPLPYEPPMVEDIDTAHGPAVTAALVQSGVA